MTELTQKEKDELRRLQAKDKKAKREEKAFWADVETRKDDIVAYLGLEQKSIGKDEEEQLSKLRSAAALYGNTVDELLDYIVTERQINYYKRQNTQRT